MPTSLEPTEEQDAARERGLDQELEATFPASDPPSAVQPHARDELDDV